MTNRLKTVQTPRLILVCGKDAVRISEIISDILNYCSYNTLIDCFTENTDFIISTHSDDVLKYKNVTADTAVFDKQSELPENIISCFINKVTSYEYCFERYGDESENFRTYSCENYDAEIMAKNISREDNITQFDVIDSGILIRVKINNTVYSVHDVLVCTAALVATGIPVAPILEYFSISDRK